MPKNKSLKLMFSMSGPRCGHILVHFGSELEQYICNHAKGFSSEEIWRKLNLVEKDSKLFPHTIPTTIL
jgi:hypothetical protein